MQRLLCVISSYCDSASVYPSCVHWRAGGTTCWASRLEKREKTHASLSAIPAVKGEAKVQGLQGTALLPGPLQHSLLLTESLGSTGRATGSRHLSLTLPSMFKALGLSPQYAGLSPGQFWKHIPHSGFPKILLSISKAISKAFHLRQAKHEETTGPMTKHSPLPSWASQYRETRSIYTQRAKIHVKPTSALNSGVMHILIHFLTFILNLMTTLVEENTQP